MNKYGAKLLHLPPNCSEAIMDGLLLSELPLFASPRFFFFGCCIRKEPSISACVRLISVIASRAKTVWTYSSDPVFPLYVLMGWKVCICCRTFAKAFSAGVV